MLAAAAQAAAPQSPVSVSTPIVVTGRGGVPFISPMGEPIRARTPNEDTLARWFNQADLNRDGILTPEEMQADAQRFFAIIDTNHDGQIDPDELTHYEWQVAPEIQVNSRLRRASSPQERARRKPQDDETDDRRSGEKRKFRDNDGGLQGAARYALLNLPEPVAAADLDFNRAITVQEFRQAALDRFQLLDKRHEGQLTLQELEAMKPVLPQPGQRRKQRDDEPDARIGVPLPPGR
jgi:Ca2+-binding EF-hand superfamily protein